MPFRSFRTAVPGSNWLACLIGLACLTPSPLFAASGFRAGAATSNISPWLGLSINGGMRDNEARYVHDELHARAIVLDDGATRLAFVVVDSCMLPREIVQAAKDRIRDRTGIGPDRVLISATHAHSAPAATPVFQSDPDAGYDRFLALKIADAVAMAVANLEPAEIGSGMGRAAGPLFNRRWKKKPGTIPADPFGALTDQVQMNPPPGSPDLIEPAGPVDPEVAVVAIRSAGQRRPIAVLSAYGLHYVGGVGPGHASADYFGAFADRVARLLAGPTPGFPPFVAAMANGTSGDVNNVDVRTPRPPAKPYEQIGRVADELAEEVVRVVQAMTYRDHLTLDARTAEIPLGVRRPSAEDVAKARSILDEMKGQPLVTREAIYARETVLLAPYPNEVPVTIQALRVGDLGIVAIPCEVFTEIGLEIKAKSPWKPTFVIELANGYNGYLPTKAQHALGGYETWRARSSYLEVDAASRITETALGLLGDLKVSSTR